MMVILFRSRTWLCLFLLLIWHILCVWVCVCACRPTVQCCVLANYQSCCSKKMVFPKGNTDFMSTIHMWGEESCTQARINMFHLLMNTWNRVCERWRWRRRPPPPLSLFSVSFHFFLPFFPPLLCSNVLFSIYLPAPFCSVSNLPWRFDCSKPREDFLGRFWRREASGTGCGRLVANVHSAHVLHMHAHTHRYKVQWFSLCRLCKLLLNNAVILTHWIKSL